MSVDRQWLIDALTDALETLSETVERLVKEHKPRLQELYRQI